MDVWSFTCVSLPSICVDLQVFRTNSSYARWAEARGAWGAIVNTCRDISRQASKAICLNVGIYCLGVRPPLEFLLYWVVPLRPNYLFEDVSSLVSLLKPRHGSIIPFKSLPHYAGCGRLSRDQQRSQGRPLPVVGGIREDLQTPPA